DRLAQTAKRLRPAPAPPAGAAALAKLVEPGRGFGPEREHDLGHAVLTQLPDRAHRDAIEPPPAAVLDDPVGPIPLGAHGLHRAKPRRRVDAEAGGRAPALRRDSLQAELLREVIDPAGAGREVADEVEDPLARGVDFGAERDGPHRDGDSR